MGILIYTVEQFRLLSASKVYIVFVWAVGQRSSLVGTNVSAEQTVSIFSTEVGQDSVAITDGLQHDATT
jgi:hypothetical protein